MLRRTALGLLALLPTDAQAQQTAQAFVEALYRPYLKKGYDGPDYTKPERQFTPDLAAAIKRDFAEAKRRNEAPTLDGDPFVDAQDWEIANLAIRLDGTRATVTFTNFGKPKRMVLDLFETQAGWRIRDIQGSWGSLRAAYKLR